MKFALTEDQIEERVGILSEKLHDATIADVSENIFSTEEHDEFTTLCRIAVEAHFEVLGSLAILMMMRIQSKKGAEDLAVSLTAEVFVSRLEAMLHDSASLVSALKAGLDMDDEEPEGSGTTH